MLSSLALLFSPNKLPKQAGRIREKLFFASGNTMGEKRGSISKDNG